MKLKKAPLELVCLNEVLAVRSEWDNGTIIFSGRGNFVERLVNSLKIRLVTRRDEKIPIDCCSRKSNDSDGLATDDNEADFCRDQGSDDVIHCRRVRPRVGRVIPVSRRSSRHAMKIFA